MNITTILLVFMTSLVFAQTQEPEIVYKGPGKVILEDGTVKEGEVYHSRVNQRRVVLKSGEAEEVFKIKELSKFFIGDLHFVPVQTAGVGENELDFAILKNQENSKIKIYEVCWQQNIGRGSDTPEFPTYREYYIQFPSQEKPKPVGDVAFMPFAKKISKLVESCPDLSKKIAGKEDGYAFGLTRPMTKSSRCFLGSRRNLSAAIEGKIKYFIVVNFPIRSRKIQTPLNHFYNEKIFTIIKHKSPYRSFAQFRAYKLYHT